MAADPLFPNVALLLDFAGADSSTTIVDKSPSAKAILRYGAAIIKTAQSKFGGSSCYFTGNSTDVVETLPSDDFAFGTGDFTLECWAYWPSNPSSNSCVFSLNASGLEIYRRTASSHALVLYLGSNLIIGSTTITNSAWHLIELSREAGVMRLFLDGALQGSVSNSTNFTASKAVVGCWSSGTSYSEPMAGYIDSVRVTKGSARHTASYTVPTEDFPAYCATITGTVADDTGAPAQRTVRAYRRDTGALADAVVSAADGTFTLKTPTTGQYTVVALDDDAGTSYEALVMDRVVPA